MTEILGLVDRFGLVIVLIGTFFEGEVFAIIGGFLAYRGSHAVETVLALAFVGSFCGDLSVFIFARYFSDNSWVQRWVVRPKFAKAIALVDRFQAYFVIVNRYVYGLRMPGLIALGLSSITVPRFLILNLLGAGIWATLFTMIGYLLGHSIASVFARLEIVEDGMLVVIGVVLVAAVIFIGWRQFGPGLVRREKQPSDDGSPGYKPSPNPRD